MSKNLNKCYSKLQFIASVKSPILRKKLLTSLSDECLYKALNEIAVNTIKGNVKLNKSQKTQLRKYKTNLIGLSKKTNNKSRKIKLIKQSGGFLPILIPAIASIIGSLIK